MDLLVLPTGVKDLWDSWMPIPRPENTLVIKKFRKFKEKGEFDAIYYPLLTEGKMEDFEQKWFDEEIKPRLKEEGQLIGY